MCDCRIQSVLRYHGAKGNVAAGSESVSVEDRYDTLVDANDQLLERVVGNMPITILCA